MGDSTCVTQHAFKLVKGLVNVIPNHHLLGAFFPKHINYLG